MKSRAAVPFVWHSRHEVRRALTQKQVIAMAAETSYCNVSIKQVEGVMDALFNVACAELKNNGMFTLAGWFRLKLKKQPATEEKWGINPVTKKPLLFKSKPASKRVRAFAMAKLKGILLRGVLHDSW